MNTRVVNWQTLASVGILATVIVAAMVFAGVPAAFGGTKAQGKIVVKRNLTLKITRLSEESARYSGKAKVGVAKQKHPHGASKKDKKAARGKAKKTCKRQRVSVFHVVPGDDFLIANPTLNRRGRYSITGLAAPFGDKVLAFMKGFTRSVKIGNKKIEVICLMAFQEEFMF